MAERVQRRREDRRAQEGHEPVVLSGTQYAPRHASAPMLPCFTPQRQTNLEGFLFPATYDFLATTTSRQLANEQLQTFCDNWTRGRPRVRAQEEPDAVRRADHRVDGREGDARARRAAARRRGDLQPPARAHAARHRRDAALRASTSRRRSRSCSRSSTATTRTTRASSSGCRRRRSPTPASRRSRRPRILRRSTTSTSCASPTACTTSSRRARRRSRTTSARTATAVR